MDENKVAKPRAQCYLGMGRTLLNQGRPQDALANLTKGHELLLRVQEQQDAEALRLLAIAEAESGEPMDEAMGRLRISRRLFRARRDHYQKRHAMDKAQKEQDLQPSVQSAPNMKW